VTRLEERIRSGLQETAERIPETAPVRETRRLRSSRPAGVWAAVAAVAAVLVLFTPILFFGGSEPGTTSAGDPQSPFLGTWVTTDFLSTMVIEASEDTSVEMIVHDFFPVCRGASTMTGIGRLQTENELVFPAPVLTCDDGSQPETISGPPIEEELQNLTLTRDPATDILTDNFGKVWTREGADLNREPTAPPSEADVTELLNGFLEARVAGDAAQQYLNVPEEDIPLLYATSSGALYDRSEFEPVRGIEWPYGLTAFKVQLFAGATVVEQLFFIPPQGRLGLDYVPDGFGTDIAPTTEDGQPVVRAYNAFDGEVTLHVAHPWVFRSDSGAIRLIPEGPGVQPTTDGGERNDWDELVMMADPAPVEPDCQTGPSPADAEALAESIRSFPDLEATAPVAVAAGGADGLMMDVVIAAGATVCETGILNLVFDTNAEIKVDNGVATGRATGDWMRLYLFDAPEGSSMRVMAMAIVAPESRFDVAVEAAAPVVASIEFHTP
jgi:hypothetical protein